MNPNSKATLTPAEQTMRSFEEGAVEPATAHEMGSGVVDSDSAEGGDPWLLREQTNEGGGLGDSSGDKHDEALTARAVAAAAQLHEYQFWFQFIEEEKPTADGRLSFMLSPGILEDGLNAIALPSISGKSTPVKLALTPGRLRPRLECDGLIVETDLPLTDYANLPRNGVSIAPVNATLRRLLATLGGRERLHEANSATFEYDQSPTNTSKGHL